MPKLKVYGASPMLSPELCDALGIRRHLRQTHAVMAAPSMRAARDTLEVGLSYIAETGNDAEVTAAMSEPGTVFYKASDGVYRSAVQALASPILRNA